MVARYQWVLVLLALCVVSGGETLAHAQLVLPGSERSLSITFLPTTPNPGDSVKLTVQSSVIDIQGGTVLWEANGKKIAQGKGMDSTSLNVGPLGSETDIDVTVVTADGETVSTQATIIPTELDLLVDSDSYTPPFFRGRPLPSAGTNLRLQALPRFKRAGATVPASELTYTWRRNGEVLGSISGRGKTTAIIPILHLYGVDAISVEARSDDGLLSHVSSLSQKAGAPLLMLYENHPLYGVLFHRALTASTFIPETETTFIAVPYFAQILNPHDPELSFEWHVNTALIPTNRTNPDELTINAENSSGVALVELHVTHTKNYFLDAKGAWNITFSPRESVANPFQPLDQ